MWSSGSFIGRPLALAACVLAAGGLHSARADLTDLVFTLEATSAAGSGSYQATLASGYWIAETYVFEWVLPEPIEIRDPGSGALIATLNGATATYVADPQVNLSFAVTAGSTATNFTIKSSLLSFPTIDNPLGRASAGFTVTDSEDDGALLTGLGGKAYLAQYNGFVPGGQTFAQLIEQIVAPPMGTASLSEEFPGGGAYLALGTSAYDMSSQISFTLSANDMASGTSNWEIVPEPCGLALLAVSVLLRRR